MRDSIHNRMAALAALGACCLVAVVLVRSPLRAAFFVLATIALAWC